MQNPAEEVRTKVVAERLNAEIGGTCVQQMYIRHGADRIRVQTVSCPRAVGGMLEVHAHFGCEAFLPRVGDAQVAYDMRAAEHARHEARGMSTLRCEWTDPATGRVAMELTIVYHDADVPGGAAEVAGKVGSMLAVRATSVVAQYGDKWLRGFGEEVRV